MPHVILTEYEIVTDRLPAVCIKCGQPATERFHRTIRFIDEPGRWGGLYMGGFLVAMFLAPPLLMPLLRRARSLEINIPFCGPDLNRFRRRERVALYILVPMWLTFVAFIDGALITGLIYQPVATCALTFGLLLWFVVVDAFVGLVTRRKKKRSKLRLPCVHPAFIAALAEDRARDRIDNPDRRDEFGDVRDDFDDQPV